MTARVWMSPPSIARRIRRPTSGTPRLEVPHTLVMPSPSPTLLCFMSPSNDDFSRDQTRATCPSPTALALDALRAHRETVADTDATTGVRRGLERMEGGR